MKKLDLICSKLYSANASAPTSASTENLNPTPLDSSAGATIFPAEPKQDGSDQNDGDLRISCAGSEELSSSATTPEVSLSTGSPLSCGLSLSLSSSSRNKRKNFQPQVVRPSQNPEIAEVADFLQNSGEAVPDTTGPTSNSNLVAMATANLAGASPKPGDPASEETRRRLRERIRERIEGGPGGARSRQQSGNNAGDGAAGDSPETFYGDKIESVLNQLVIDTTTGIEQAADALPMNSEVDSLLEQINAGDSECFILRFNGNECGFSRCKSSFSKEHYHCKTCNYKPISKKEEVLRHYKWHRRREESLAQGFLRIGGNENCSPQFKNCPYNLKQTHYHCIQNGCSKVYVSTSDVQLHANSHRKSAFIVREGFQRVRASEKCDKKECPFGSVTPKTTHFHCLTPSCSHSFKNKADIEKHKLYHLKLQQMASDGFRKFLKSTACVFKGCAYSCVVNHIHCMRPGCEQVLQSASQMGAHKKRHDRQDESHGQASPRGVQPARQNGNNHLDATIASISKNGSLQQTPSFFFAPPPPQLQQQQPPQQKWKIKQYQPESQKFIGDEGDSEDDFDEEIEAIKRSRVGAKAERTAPPPAAAEKPFAGKGPSLGKLKITRYDPRKHDSTRTPGKNQQNSTDSSGSDEEIDPGMNEQHFTMSTAPLKTTTDSPATATSSQHASNLDPALPNPAFLTLASYAALMGNPLLPQFLSSLLASSTAASTINVSSIGQPSMVTTTIAGTKSPQMSPTTAAKSGKGDDSWTKHIKRFTANDPCFPLCGLIYKDHYHCMAGDGCTALFRSKDGVRDHAKQHDLLGQASVHYEQFGEDDTCSHDECQFSNTEAHYHCKWSNCDEAIGASEPVFRRLEHFKVHEYSSSQRGAPARGSSHRAPGTALNPARVGCTTGHKSEGSSSPDDGRRSSSDAGSGQGDRRKRGRPPKYQVLGTPSRSPAIHPDSPAAPPDVMLASFKLPRFASSASKRGRPRTVSSPKGHLLDPTSVANRGKPATSVRSGYSRPLQNPYNNKPQYEGFFTYLPTEICAEPQCRFMFQLHYHCRIPRCFYATNKIDILPEHAVEFHRSLEIPEGFACYDRSYRCKFESCQHDGQVRHFHCMKPNCSESFVKVASLAEHAGKEHPWVPPQPTSSHRKSSQDNNSKIKTNGIYFPIETAKNSASLQTGSKMASSSAAKPAAPNPAAKEPNQSKATIPYTVEQHCGRPFCKLKRRLHYHCSVCFQGFSNFERLQPHLQKHNITVPTPPPNVTMATNSRPPPLPPGAAAQTPSATNSSPFLNFQALAAAGFLPGLLQQFMAASAANLPGHPPGFSQSVASRDLRRCEERKTSANASHHADNGNRDSDSEDDKSLVGKLVIEEHSNEFERRPSANSIVARPPSVESLKKITFHSFQPEMLKFNMTDDKALFSRDPDSDPEQDDLDLKNQELRPRGVVRETMMINEPRTSSGCTITMEKPVIPASSASVSSHNRTLKFVDCTDSARLSITPQDSKSTPGEAAKLRPKKSSASTAFPDISQEPFAKIARKSPSAGSNSSAARGVPQKKEGPGWSFEPPEAEFEERRSTNQAKPMQISEAPSVCQSKDCDVQSRGQHFHCTKCESWFSDSTKLALHLKQHAKSECIASYGFKRVSPSEGNRCPEPSCSFTAQAHYHCLHCDFIALANAQMSVHKEQHGL